MTDTCITIDDSSDEDDVQIMDPPAVQLKPESSEEVKRKIPLKTIETGKSVFTTLLSTCKNVDPSSDMDVIVNKMWKSFHEADSSYTSSTKFIDFVKTLIEKVPEGPCLQLKSVKDDLKFNKKRTKSSPAESVAQPGASSSANLNEVDRKTQRNVRKLEQLYSKLQKKIDFLEKQEVDLADSSDEQNSAYMQVCRYKTRICDVFKKLCELRKEDTSDNCFLRNIKFSGSRIPAVNRAIEKFYNHTREFPDFMQVLTIVKKANELKNLRLSSDECYETAEEAFKEFGETLKRQRQIELTEDLKVYLENSDGDPASKNQLLEEKLQENDKLYGNRIDEIIDKYAKKQIEDKLEPEEVPDDAASETAAEDDEDDEADEDISSVGEVESNADESSADEGETKTDEDDEPEKPFEGRDFRIVLPDLLQMPEWAAYQKAKRAHPAAGYAATVCSPVPGCSKDVVNDFCMPCASKGPASSAKKRIHPVVVDESDDDSENESPKKVAKVDGPLVDLTADSQSSQPATQVVDLLPTSCGLVDEDPLGSVKATCSQVPNGITDESTTSSTSESESSKPQQFVVVDVKSILARKPVKHMRYVRHKTPNGSKFTEKPTSKTESVVTRKDAVADDVPVSDPSLKNHLKTLSKNGIRIVNVTSSSSSDNKSGVPTNHVKDRVENQTKNEKNGTNVKKKCEVIDVEETSRREKTVSDAAARLIKNFSAEPKSSTPLFSKAVPNTNQNSRPVPNTNQNSRPVPNTNQNSKPSFFRSGSYQETKKSLDNRPPWQKLSPSCNRFPATSTPKPNTTHQPRPNFFELPRPSLNHSNFGPRCYPGQRNPTFQPQFGGPFNLNRNPRGGTFPPRPRNVYMGPNAAMTKRTVQTTQKFIKGNNIYTQTMTVVQEVQMQPGGGGVIRNQFASNGRVGSTNPRFGGGPTQSRTASSNPNGSVPQDPRQKMKRKNSADVITLE